MGIIQGLTKARMLAIEAASVVSGYVDGDYHLILTKFGGGTIDAGYVRGAIGPSVVLPDATTSVKGISELATNAEAITGTDTTRTVTPSNVKAVLNDSAPIKVSFTNSSLVTIPCSGFDEYEIEWAITVNTGYLVMQIGTTGVPLTTALYDSNNVYGGGTNASPTNAADMKEMATFWPLAPASSSSRNFFNGFVKVLNLNIAEKARMVGILGSNIDGGTSSTANSTAVATINGNHRTTGATQNEIYLRASGAGTITGYYVLRKIKYQV